MAHSDQFTAKGPPFNGAGVPRAGFSTIKTDFDFVDGVNAQGEHCGVYGESLIGEIITNRRSPEKQTGVCGVGLDYGVYGSGNFKAGVYGTGLDSSRATGVMGVCKPQKTAPSVDDGGGIGVLGATGYNNGIGVVGLSLGEINTDAVNGLPHVEIDDEGLPHAPSQELSNSVGVLGMTGDGTGVFGYSDSHIGIRGFSKGGRGGVFQTNKLVAQVRLVPLRLESQKVELPALGSIGDLLLTRQTALIAGKRQIDKCNLWLCVSEIGGDPKSDTSGTWQEVLLGPAIKGTVF